MLRNLAGNLNLNPSLEWTPWRKFCKLLCPSWILLVFSSRPAHSCSVRGPSSLHMPAQPPPHALDPLLSREALPSTHSISEKEVPQTILGSRVITRDSDWQLPSTKK